MLLTFNMKLLLAIFFAIYLTGIYCDTTSNTDESKNAAELADIETLNLSIPPEDEYQVQLVQVLFRHGDRVPDRPEIYETDPYDEIFRSHGYGQLTKTGKKRQYRIGQILRKRYGEFLGEFQNRDIHAYSTNVDRTKMSLQLVLAGLYPPTNKTSWSDEILWQPIPTHSNDYGTDFLMGFSCPKFEKAYKEVGESQEVKDRLKKYDDFYEFLRNTTKITTFTPTSVFMIYNNLRSALSLGLELPQWCGQEKYKTLLEVAPIAMEALTFTNFMKRTMGGLLIEKMLENIQLHNIDPDKKMYLYSAHDLNIASFGNVHNFTNIPSIPDYGSTIIVEKLIKKGSTDKQNYVRMFMWTGAGEKWIPLKLNNCDTACPLAEYKKLTNDLLPDNIARECTSINSLCKRPEYLYALELPYELSSLYAGKDLKSFKYMDNFVSPYEIRRIQIEEKKMRNNNSS